MGNTLREAKRHTDSSKGVTWPYYCGANGICQTKYLVHSKSVAHVSQRKVHLRRILALLTAWMQSPSVGSQAVIRLIERDSEACMPTASAPLAIASQSQSVASTGTGSLWYMYCAPLQVQSVTQRA